MGGSSAEEFPLLSALGLYAANIRGDGNCLFNALSDQLYGDQNQHAAIRSKVIDYMREHAEYYKQFIEVHPGGGVRRNPKRKNAASYSTPVQSSMPSEAEINRVFEDHLQRMAKGGTYGDNMEIVAFSSAFDRDIKVYQRDFAYMISGKADEAERPVLHIAYHMWEHYSSIRNVNGPHAGLPVVSPKLLSPAEEQQQKTKLENTSPVLPWQIDVVSKSLPYLADKATIKRYLAAAKGNIDLAVSNMLEAEEYGSGSSQQETSSVERDQDSEDDAHAGPNKKQDRRMSRTTKAQKARSLESKKALSRLSVYDGSQESVASWTSEDSSEPESSQRSSMTQPTDVEEHEPDVKRKDGKTSGNEAPPPPNRQIKLKIHGPKSLPPATIKIGKTQQRQQGPRITARDLKDIKKQAQKMKRKERQQAATRATRSGRSQSPSAAGVALRSKGMTGTPPADIFRTLYL